MSREMTRILHIITGLNDGGAEAVLYNLVRHADQFDHTVISLMGPGKYGPKLEAEGVEVSYLGLRPSWPSPLKLLRLGKMVRRARPDVIQTWMYHADLLGGYAAWRAGYRRIIWGLRHTTLDRRGTKWTTRQLVRLNTRFSRWLPKRIISCSKTGVDVHGGIGFATDNMVVVHNGYDTAAFRPDTAARCAIRAEFGIAADTLLLGLVARYNPQKDHRNLVSAFAELARDRADLHLLLVGPGLNADNAEVVSLLADAGIGDRVTLAGPRPDIPAIMNGLDLHVMSSAFGEAFPNVLAEAMACGTPCVSTDVGDSALIVGETGWIVPPRDPDALAEAIRMALTAMQDRGAWAARQCAARLRIEDEFSLSAMVSGYRAVWAATDASA